LQVKQATAAAIRLDEYATTPLYNIKAVVQATAISPSTLRAWERRYNMCQPQRSESGYRLYSDRDIAVIRWLKTQVDAGMSISQAVAWLNTLTVEAKGDSTRLPTPAARTLAPSPAPRTDAQTHQTLAEQLLDALLRYDEMTAEQVMAVAFSLYPIEQVGERVIQPVMVEIGERWHRGELSVTREHYATNYVLQRLAAILRTLPSLHEGPELWVGCAPGELHEMGAMLLAIFLRRAGYQVRYLGQDLPIDDLLHEVQIQQPAIVLFSATSVNAATHLRHLCDALTKLDAPRPVMCYGGRAFNLHPELRDNIAGVYLGATAAEAAEGVRDVLRQQGATQPRSVRA
jgi:methanogenic corrinoid protein MtbC1